MEVIILIISLVIDSFVASLGYGCEKIKIPNSSILVINIVSSFILALSIFFGNTIKGCLPSKVPHILSFVIFFSIGIYKLFEGLAKKYLSKYSNKEKPLTFKLFDMNFAMQVYVNEKKADFDKSKKLSLKEAFYLSLALSLDSLAVGIGVSFLSLNYIYIVILSFIFGIISLKIGSLIGDKFISNSNIDLSPLAGLCLLIIAFSKL